MAGAKINTKSKGKDDKSKGNKNLSSNNEEIEDHDFSVLRKPVLTSITGFAQARKIFDFATEELKSLLANECDLLYECKVCRNIFRSLANFISHKRVYCKEKFSSSVHSHFIKNTSVASEMIKIRQMEEAYQESLKLTETVPTESNDRIPLSKDLTGIVEKLAKIKGRYSFDEQQVTLQKIPNSSVAVFQSHGEEKKLDSMQAQVQELDNMLSQDRAVLQKDGSFNVQSSLNDEKKEDSDNVIQISDDDDSDDGRVPKCKICDMQFSTQKTLRYHMKYKHLESRLVYPCPDCLEIFSTSWSVYRHLFKVHRKSAAQIRRLREAIQAKAFKMNNPPAFYEKKKNMKAAAQQKLTEEERLDQENQAWMDSLEGLGSLPRCGGCGRTFERRAALAAHTHTCQPRSRALARRPAAHENKKIEIQIRKDYNKGPPGLNLMPKAEPDIKPAEETQTASKPRIDKTSEPAENTDQTIQNDPPGQDVQPDEKANKSAEEEEPMETSQEVVEKNSEPTENILEEATMDIIEDKSSDSAESPEKHVPEKQSVDKIPRSRLPFAVQIEKNNLVAFKKRMEQDVDLEKLLCKRCDSKHTRMQDLHEHMAEHYKWMRYACKLCNFKHYDFAKVPEHVKIVHKLKGDSDFYFSTVKAIDGSEALELSEPLELCDVNEESSESRRPSRCSSDSSRLSDDSSSSSVRLETGAKKRKMYHNRTSNKRRKEALGNDEADDVKESDVSMDKIINNSGDIESSPNAKIFEENSSDMEELEEKLSKRHITKQISSVASRRPVRKKTKPKNEDFEYDLSNLLKMEAQGYRDSQTVTTPKMTQTKKKIQQEFQNNYDNINKECVGALLLMTKKTVDKAAAELKTTNFSAPIFNIQKEHRLSNVFARPMLPKTSRTEKMSPKKDNLEEPKDNQTSNKVTKIQEANPNNDTKCEKVAAEENAIKLDKDDPSYLKRDTNERECVVKDQSSNSEPSESAKPKLKIPSVVPIKFRRQSLELMKNPIINKNITEFSKAGMKTKILLIKPINRNKDGVSNNTPLKFQTIKLKETNKGLAPNEDKPNDQIVVVKVPKVNRAVARTVPDKNVNVKQLVPLTKTDTINEATERKKEVDKTIGPVAIDENNAEKSNVKTSNISCSNSEQNDVDCSSLRHSGTSDFIDNNVDKIGCGNEISSIASENSNEVPEPMDIEELGTIGSNILETVSEDTSVSEKSVVSQIESTNAKSKLSIPELAVNSIIHNPLDLETIDETVNTHIKEPCNTFKDAIIILESTNQDSEPNIVTNGDIASL